MDITIIGVPMDLGADRRGVDMGPSAIRYAGLNEKLRALGHTVRDQGTVAVPVPDPREPGNHKLKYLDPILVATRDLAARTEAAVRGGSLPLVLGGDHSIALGSIAGVAHARGEIGVIWFDAHADFNTSDTSPSGNIHGMILGALNGYGDPALVNATGQGPELQSRRVVIVGARDLDVGERMLLREAGVHVFTMADIDRLGMYDVTRQAIALATDGTNGLHVSFDLDGMDPSEAPGVGTPVPGGLTYREAHLAMELVAESAKLISMDLVEVNPILDQQNKTGLLATELALSATGKHIY
ncbi:MAG: Arginase [Ktedonobacterales bacterium]|jgi:arginase|nr:MAG: Arginase [Ktedonobacterales bacterium]